MTTSRSPTLPTTGKFGLTVGALVLVALFALRFVVECVFLLPSPVADAAYFLTSSANYCDSGFLGTTIYPIDPTGQARMVWHGFVSPMLFSAVNVHCGARNYYLTLWLIKALTSIAIFVLARWRHFSQPATLGLIFFALAAQTGIGFRPESLAILLVVLADLAIERKRHVFLGGILGTLLCTQPTVAGLWGLSMAVLRPELMKRWLPVAVGGVGMLVILLSIYPFPTMDLVSGIRLQAQRLVSRTDGSLISYYLLIPSLPGWSLLLLAGIAFAAQRRLLTLALIPVVWFFGPRVPPVFYNLVPTCLLLMIVTFGWIPPKLQSLFGAAALAVGVLGLSFMSLRDVMTIYRYGDTFSATSARIAHLSAEGADFATVPPFLALTNPVLGFTDPTAKPKAPVPSEKPALNVFAVSGSPDSPCPRESGSPTVSLAIGDLTVYRSNSGWMVYICERPTAARI